MKEKKTEESSFHSVEDDLTQALQQVQKGPVSLRSFFIILSGRGKPLVLLFLSLPFCLPIQIPGLSTPFGIAILIIGIRLALGGKIWLPKFLLDKQVSSKTLKKTLSRAIWVIKKLKKISRTRWTFISKHNVFRRIHGVFIAFLGFFLALPLPIPLTNIVAAWGIFLVSLGLLEDDGLMIAAGYAIIALATLFIVFFVISL